MYVIFQFVQYTICYKNLIMLNVFNFLLLNKKTILLTSCVKFQNNTLIIMQNTAYLIWMGQNWKSQK